MFKYAKYKIGGGPILGVMTSNLDKETILGLEYFPDDQSLLEFNDDPQKFYVENDELKPKKDMLLNYTKSALQADGLDVVSFIDIPVGTVFRYLDSVIKIDDGELIFTTTIKGSQKLLFEHYAYNILEVTLDGL